MNKYEKLGYLTSPFRIFHLIDNNLGEITTVLEKNICGSQDTATASWVYAPAYKID